MASCQPDSGLFAQSCLPNTPGSVLAVTRPLENASGKISAAARVISCSRDGSQIGIIVGGVFDAALGLIRRDLSLIASRR